MRVMSKTIHQSFAVPFDYPVVFTHGVFRPENTALVDVLTRRGEDRLHRVAVYIDAGVAGTADAARRYFDVHRERAELVAPPRVLAGGEAIKNVLAAGQGIVDELIALRMDRQSFVIAVGGGALLDAVGFAAALLHRGLRLIRLPTTVLAQNDAGVGVKNAINYQGGKNMLGTFAPPFGVINDLEFLQTLSGREWTDGIAEAFKVAIIKDEPFFRALCETAPALRRRDGKAMEDLVVRCAELHLEHIRSNGDPFEFGRARPLDFGHWSAHKLELLSGFRVSHGQAVAIGIALDTQYALLQGWLNPEESDAIHAGLRNAGFRLWHDLLETRLADGRLAILDGLRDFREHLGGELCVTMPMGLGRKFEVNEIDTDLMARSISRLKHADSSPAPTPSDLLP